VVPFCEYVYFTFCYYVLSSVVSYFYCAFMILCCLVGVINDDSLREQLVQILYVSNTQPFKSVLHSSLYMYY